MGVLMDWRWLVLLLVLPTPSSKNHFSGFQVANYVRFHLIKQIFIEQSVAEISKMHNWALTRIGNDGFPSAPCDRRYSPVSSCKQQKAVSGLSYTELEVLICAPSLTPVNQHACFFGMWGETGGPRANPHGSVEEMGNSTQRVTQTEAGTLERGETAT